MTEKRVLWLDDNPMTQEPYIGPMVKAGFSVTVKDNVSEAEKELETNDFDLLILDVMIPTLDSREEEIYTPSDTDQGRKTGLLFYKRMKSVLENKRIAVLVFTIDIHNVDYLIPEFQAAGLNPENVTTKFELRDVNNFLHKLNKIMSRTS